MKLLVDKQPWQQLMPLRQAALIGVLQGALLTSVVPAQATGLMTGPKGEKKTDQAAKRALSNDIKNMSAQYTKGRYILAENLGRAILQTDPTNLDTHYLMGNVYYKLNDPRSALEQYNYCIQSGQNSEVAKLAATALANLTTKFKDLDRMTSGASPEASARAGAAASSAAGSTSSTAAGSAALSVETKPADLATLKRAETILQRAQDDLTSKKQQLDTVISHTEEFARSRIREIPFNMIYRRMSAFAGIEAARDNEDYYTAPNYDRPMEVAKIKATETAKVHRYIGEYSSQEKTVISNALTAVDALLGGTSDRDGKPQSTAVATPIRPLKTPKTPASINEALTACGITNHKESSGNKVIMVATGSAAHRAGLMPGDLIVQSTLIPGADLFKLMIRRNGQHYLLKMHPQASAAAKAGAQAQALAKSSAATTAAKPTSSQLAWARIKDSDIVFVQDMSSAMRQPLGETGLSKWDWCAGRIIDFAESLSKGNSMGFTLIQCYQYVYESYVDQSPGVLRQRLAASRAMEAANITTPLENVANDYLDSGSRKPLLIMVFTDGHPERGESMEAAVKSITDRVKSQDQIRLVFFQIGDDAVGTAMTQMLDNDLTYTGQKYDIVDCVKFDDLQELGVSRALLEAYEKPRTAGKTVPPPMSLALSAKLEKVRQQIAAAH